MAFTNVFEPVVCALSADVNAAMNVLRTLAANTHTTPRMTGSGSCVFLPVPSDFDKIASNTGYNPHLSGVLGAYAVTKFW